MIGGRISRNLAIGFASQLFYKIAGFAILALLARQLTVEDYGKLMFTLALCSTSVLLTDLGISTDLVRRVAARPTSAARRIAAAVSARIPLLALYVIAVNIWVAFTTPELLPVSVGIAIYSALKDLYRTHASLYLGLHRVSDTVYAFGSGLTTTLIGIALGTVFNCTLPWIVSCYVAGGVVHMIVATWITRARVGPLRFRLRKRRIHLEVCRSLPLFVLSTLGVVHLAANTIMLGYLQPYEQVASYEVAGRLMEASQFLVRPLTMTMFPICAGLATECAWSKLQQFLGRMLAGAVGIGLLLCAFMGVVAGPLIRIIYSEAYVESANVLRILYLSVPFLFVSTVGTFLTAALHRERLAVVVTAAGLSLHVIAGLWVIPRYGPEGAAWLTVFSQASIAIAFTFHAYRTLSLRLRSQSVIRCHNISSVASGRE